MFIYILYQLEKRKIYVKKRWYAHDKILTYGILSYISLIYGSLEIKVLQGTSGELKAPRTAIGRQKKKSGLSIGKSLPQNYYSIIQIYVAHME